MPKPAIKLKKIPKSATSETTLKICLKCAFDFFINELSLSPGGAYSELLRHTPEASDFSGAATSRPHFFDEGGRQPCPFCKASKSWSARFHALRVYAHPAFAEARKKAWARLEKAGERFDLSCPEQTGMEIFSAWLDELKQKVGFGNPSWWLETVAASISFFNPSFAWDQVLTAKINKVQCTSSVATAWSHDQDSLHLSPPLYGDALLVDHLIARSMPNRKGYGERRISLSQLMNRLRRIGYLKLKGIPSSNDHEAFEQAVESLVASSPTAVYYAVDRKEYLKRLKIIYKKYTD
jgi:hypothetical protein